jgi:RNA polymerase sigma factor (TIGR02999 family)
MQQPGDATRTDTGTVTRLLAQLEGGDEAALDELFPIVYDELRSIARRHRRGWDGDTTIGTTALVHEAYLKLTGVEQVRATSRLHFLRVASRAMRQILSNYARDRRAAKRGGDAAHIPLEIAGEGVTDAGQVDVDTVASLEEALRKLEEVDRRLSDVVECRFYGGMSIEDTAAALDVSPATVKRDWALAKAWLYRELTAT